MTLTVDVGGRRRVVMVRRSGRSWVVSVDGREICADLAAADGRWSLLMGEGPAEAGHASGPVEVGPCDRPPTRSYEIALEPRADGRRAMFVDGQPVPIAMADPRAFGRRGRAASPGSVSGRVVAPMPGRVLKVLARSGDTVSAGQALIVVEAMKMENEVRAPRAGTVSDVRVVEGMSVDANTVLMHVE